MPSAMSEPTSANESGDVFRIADRSTNGPVGRMRFRRSTQGPELELVKRFCESLRASYRNEALSLFVEPRVHGHYPDLVAVFWDERRTLRWPQSRASLALREIRYLHLLHKVSRISVDELVCTIGRRATERLVTRLLDAKVASLRDWFLVARPLQEIFAVRRIVAFEAKVSDWRLGLEQAFVNSWFSSESFLLLPRRAESNHRLAARASELGIGVIGVEQRLAHPGVKPRRERIPKSYASWLFNEWAWQRVRGGAA
jgi:hypothetical protein